MCGKLIAVVILFTLVFKGSISLNITNRLQWGARAAISKTFLSDNLPYVVIHHTYIPEACFTPSTCTKAMQVMQNMHMDDNGWDDIGYNFAIGGDGRIYEGRGFGVQGAHSPGYNVMSIGIVLIGDWSDFVPSSNMISATKYLIWQGISKGYLKSDYILYGHRQVRKGTDCPGNALYREIKNWPHWRFI